MFYNACNIVNECFQNKTTAEPTLKASTALAFYFTLKTIVIADIAVISDYTTVENLVWLTIYWHLTKKRYIYIIWLACRLRL